MALKIAESGVSVDICAGLGWRYADAMQAESKKRQGGVPEAIAGARSFTHDKDGNCLHFHHEFGHKKCMDCGASLEEWQPDWSLAPDLFYWWAIDGFSGQAYWYRNKPFIDSEQKEWDIQVVNNGEYKVAPTFGYTGDWRDSLRKRPEMEVERK
ncbi:hypothetical protein [Acinetobacter piscicola]|uniref:hypothetical protein n=1 Tax=Acinetobacter piscicola TaxID=2006115 RepID=UPI001BC87F56|nr:hypothetical protein [Acinetobacter piscicola]